MKDSQSSSSSPGTRGAKEMTWMDVPGEKLLEPKANNPYSYAYCIAEGGGLFTLFLPKISYFPHMYSSGWYGRYAEVAGHAEANRCN